MDQHTVKRFDQELYDLKAIVVRMGELVQMQITRAMEALREEDLQLAREVIARDHVVNFMDVQADEQIVNLLALRQPMGRDLRTIMSLGKTVTDLERIGDEAEAIARMALQIHERGGMVPAPVLLRDAYTMATLARLMVNQALDALARLDIGQALQVTQFDAELDRNFQAALRRLATYLLEDSGNLGHTLNVTFILRSLERIGDHAKNISEYVVYLVKGKDVRHVSPESVTRDILEDG